MLLNKQTDWRTGGQADRHKILISLIIVKKTCARIKVLRYCSKLRKHISVWEEYCWRCKDSFNALMYTQVLLLMSWPDCSGLLWSSWFVAL